MADALDSTSEPAPSDLQSSIVKEIGNILPSILQDTIRDQIRNVLMEETIALSEREDTNLLDKSAKTNTMDVSANIQARDESAQSMTEDVSASFGITTFGITMPSKMTSVVDLITY